MIEITYDINKQFGKRFTDFRSEEFVNVQYTFRKIFDKFKIIYSTCDEKKEYTTTNYEIKLVANSEQKELFLNHLKEEVGEDNVYLEDEKYICLIPCKPYIINEKTNEKIEADDFDLKVYISIFETQEEMLKKND